MDPAQTCVSIRIIFNVPHAKRLKLMNGIFIERNDVDIQAIIITIVGFYDTINETSFRRRRKRKIDKNLTLITKPIVLLLFHSGLSFPIDSSTSCIGRQMVRAMTSKNLKSIDEIIFNLKPKTANYYTLLSLYDLNTSVGFRDITKTLSPHCQWTNNIPSGSRQWVANDDLLSVVGSYITYNNWAARPERNLWPREAARVISIIKKGLSLSLSLSIQKSCQSPNWYKAFDITLFILSFPLPLFYICLICIRTCKWAALSQIRYGLALLKCHTPQQPKKW